MAQIAIPDDLVNIFAACEVAYAEASQKGYAANPEVITAVADLKSAYKALLIANCTFAASKGPFDKAAATLRARRACSAFRAASLKLQTTMEQAAMEDRLYNRSVVLLKSMAAQGGKRV